MFGRLTARNCAIVFWVVYLTALFGEGVKSAEFRKEATTTSGPDLIGVYGDLLEGDERKFIDTAISSQNALVIFHSRGGSLSAGIEIGRAIRLKGFTTYVPDDMLCASACAIAWLGGRIRMMSDTGRVGFHAVYTNENGRTNTSSAGNAVVGAYLNQIGLPTSAIVYITEAAPDGMQWLNFEDAQRFGIDVKLLNLTSKSTPARVDSDKTPDRPNTRAQIRDAVAGATREFVEATNRPREQALGLIAGTLAETVQYYGVSKSSIDVLADKSRFFQRWPERQYSIQAESLSVNCLDDTNCQSSGSVNWRASNGKSVSTGKASFQYGWIMDGRAWKLNSESSKIISRKVSKTTSLRETTGPRYTLDEAGSDVVALSNLFSSGDCHPFKTTGIITKRTFDIGGIVPNGIVIQYPDGERGYVNVSVEIDAINLTDRSWLVKGLQRLLSEGRSIEAELLSCGASGRVIYLTAIHAAH